MRYLCFFLLGMLLASCSVLMQDEEEMDKIIEDLIHEELSRDF